MIWNEHYRDVRDGAHAPFGASKYSWINYDEEKALSYYKALLATQKGTELHALAKSCIQNRVQLKGRNTLAKYVNDAIGFKMRPEQILFYSPNFFGTTDAICFKNNLLRIHDLKTGVNPAKMEQLLIYDALFCLEYRVKPDKIEHELRIYQNDDVMIGTPTGEDITPIMEKIVRFDQIIEDYKKEL